MRSADYQEASLYTPKGRRKYLTPQERGCFIQAANKCSRIDLGTLALTLAYTGCRITEALSLTRSAINLESGFIAIRTLKRGRVFTVREIPVPSYFLNILELAFGISSGEPDARIWTLTRGQFWRLIKGLMREAGVAFGVHATPKGLRHGFGVHAVNSGVPLNLIQRWLGHASMKTTAIYLQVVGREEREIAGRMWA
jgi:integrase